MMSINAEQLIILRRYIAEPTVANFTDMALNDLFMASGADLNFTAAEVWRGKAAIAANLVDESEGPSSLKLSQLYDRAMAQAIFYDSRSTVAPVGPVRRRTTTRAIERA